MENVVRMTGLYMNADVTAHLAVTIKAAALANTILVGINQQNDPEDITDKLMALHDMVTSTTSDLLNEKEPIMYEGRQHLGLSRIGTVIIDSTGALATLFDMLSKETAHTFVLSIYSNKKSAQTEAILALLKVIAASSDYLYDQVIQNTKQLISDTEE